MSNRSLPVIVAVVVSLLVLSACSAAVPTVTAEGTRDILLCVFVLLGVVLFCLAQGMTIPMPWGVLSPPGGRVRRRNQGLLGGALILLGAIGLFIPLPENNRFRQQPWLRHKTSVPPTKRSCPLPRGLLFPRSDR